MKAVINCIAAVTSGAMLILLVESLFEGNGDIIVKANTQHAASASSVIFLTIWIGSCLASSLITLFEDWS